MDPELIDMQKAFVQLLKGTWEGIGRAVDFDKKRLQKTALEQEFAPREECGRRAPAGSRNYALPARSS
jgi:hypothetical protein